MAHHFDLVAMVHGAPCYNLASGLPYDLIFCLVVREALTIILIPKSIRLDIVAIFINTGYD